MKLNFRKRKGWHSVLALALDGSRLDGVALKRAGGALQIAQQFSIALTLDPLTAAPELVGRELRNQLDAAGVRERHCVFGVPLKWVLTAQTELPPLPEADAKNLLQMEAERGFHSDAATLQIADSRSALGAEKKFVLLGAIPQPHLAALEKILAAAKLKPVSFALGLAALQPPAAEKSKGVLALRIGENNVGLQITAGGGVVALRALEGAVTEEAGRKILQADIVARETRVTLGQLPAEFRAAVKRIRIFGPREFAAPLADEMELRFEPMGLTVEIVSGYAANEFGATLPVEVSVSPEFSLAARALVEQPPAFEFLPPKPSLFEQLTSKYGKGRWRMTGAIAGGIILLVALIFLFQQFQWWRLRTQWNAIAARVGDLQNIQDNIREYRSWYAGDFRTLAILRQLSLAFPEDGAVTAKNITIRDGNLVTCTGTARDYAALLAMQARLRAADGVGNVQLEQVRGKTPMQFVFGFTYGTGGSHAN